MLLRLAEVGHTLNGLISTARASHEELLCGLRIRRTSHTAASFTKSAALPALLRGGHGPHVVLACLALLLKQLLLLVHDAAGDLRPDHLPDGVGQVLERRRGDVGSADLTPLCLLRLHHLLAEGEARSEQP